MGKSRAASVVLLLLLLPDVAVADENQPNLVVAVVAGEPTPTLRFTITNLGASPIEWRGFARSDNGPVVMLPDDTVLEDRSSIDYVDKSRRMAEVPPEKLAAGTRQSWDRALRNIAAVEPADSLPAGEYRVYWRFKDLKSNEIVLEVGNTRETPANRAPLPLTSATPRGALWSFCKGLDGGRLQQVCAIATTQKQSNDFFEATLGREDAFESIRSALSDKFGPEAGAGLSLEATEAVERAIANAPVTFGPYFQTATILLSPPIGLKLSDNEWCVCADSFTTTNGDVPPRMAQGSFALQKLEAQIRGGEFASAKESLEKINATIRDHGWRVLTPEGTAPAGSTTKPSP
jgi:hypothetical protein